MKSVQEPFTIINNKLTYHFCKQCGYKEETQFYTAHIKQRRRLCKACICSIQKKKRNRSEAVKLLYNLRKTLCKTHPNLSRAWEECDVIDVLKKYDYKSDISGTIGSLCIVPIDHSLPLTPNNARPILTKEAQGRLHRVRSQ